MREMRGEVGKKTPKNRDDNSPFLLRHMLNFERLSSLTLLGLFFNIERGGGYPSVDLKLRLGADNLSAVAKQRIYIEWVVNMSLNGQDW